MYFRLASSRSHIVQQFVLSRGAYFILHELVRLEISNQCAEVMRELVLIMWSFICLALVFSREEVTSFLPWGGHFYLFVLKEDPWRWYFVEAGLYLSWLPRWIAPFMLHEVDLSCVLWDGSLHGPYPPIYLLALEILFLEIHYLPCELSDSPLFYDFISCLYLFA